MMQASAVIDFAQRTGRGRHLPPPRIKIEDALARVERCTAWLNKAGVAIRLGYGRAMIARVLSPNDPLQITDALAQRVIDRFYVVAECPATGLAQPRSECRRLAGGAAPMHNPLSMRIWRLCQTCPHKPEAKK